MSKKENQDDKKKKRIILIILFIIILILLLLFFWKPKYDIVFDTNGGSEVTPLIVEKNGLIKEPKDPVKEGYIFAGWYYNDELFDFDTPVTDDMELEARWVKKSEVTGIELNYEELTMNPGDKDKLVVKVLPDKTETDEVTWKSSDSNVVSVDENGNITALKEGKATITVTTKDGKHTTEIKIIVNKDIVKVTGVSLDKKNISLNVNEKAKLTATIKPKNATNKNVTWKSSNPKVATVDKNGNITALKEGTTTITVTTKDGGYTATATVKVTAIKVKSVSLDKTSVSLYVNENTKLSAVVKPENATNKGVTWTSSNPEVATVDQNGNVKALKKGTTTITVKTKDGGYTAECVVTVKEVSVTGVSLNKTSATLTVDESVKLTATVKPNNAANKGVTWTSSNPDVATVDQNGNVKALSKGTTTITVTAKDGGYTATCVITVKEKEVKYTVVLKEIKLDVVDASFQYEVSVLKDGNSFSDYKGIEYNGVRIAKGNHVSKTQYNNSVTTAKVYINGADSPVNATVIYK